MADYKVDPRFIQALVGFGSDLSRYGGNTDVGFQPTDLNIATTKNLSAQSMLRLMKQALGPDNLTVKASNKGLTINVPNPEEPEQLAGPGMEEVKPQSPGASALADIPMVQMGTGRVNPFAGLTNADVAGLSPQDIMSVVSAKHAQDALEQKSYTDAIEALTKSIQLGQKERELQADIPYKEALTTQHTPSITVPGPGGTSIKMTPTEYNTFLKNTKVDELDKPFVINALGKKEGTTLREWNALPKEEQEYQMFLFGEKEALGSGPQLTRKEFMTLKPTERDRFFDRFMKEPSFKAAALEWAKANTMNLGDVVSKKEATDMVERQSNVMSPDYPRKIMKDTVEKKGWEFDNSDAIDGLMKKHPGLSKEDATTAYKRAIVRHNMDREIKQAFQSKTVEWRKDGWYIGDKMVVRDPYAK